MGVFEYMVDLGTLWYSWVYWSWTPFDGNIDILSQIGLMVSGVPGNHPMCAGNISGGPGNVPWSHLDYIAVSPTQIF